jgi:hypothetical protein
MRPGEAIVNLSRKGFKFEVAGDKLRYRYEGPGDPNPGQARLLLEVVKAHKAEALRFLANHAFTCFECKHFSPGQSPNPTEALGRCHKSGEGRFGCAMACEVGRDLGVQLSYQHHRAAK